MALNNNDNNIHNEEYYMKQIEEQKEYYERLAKKKNQEIEELFSQIEKENQELKREILQCKIELEEEKSNTQNMKETYFNINSFDESNPELDRIVYENIKYIKEKNEKKLNEITDLYKIQLNNAIKDSQSIRKNIRLTIDNYDTKSSIDFNESIISYIQAFENKINTLIEENFNKEKYSLLLNQKYELATEENNFLKNKIMQEKTNICEQVSQIQKQNIYSHFEIIQNLLNELSEQKHNYFNIKFNESFDELSNLLTESVEKNKVLAESNENMKKLCEELNLKLSIITKEKDRLLEETKKKIVDCELNKTKDLNYNAMKVKFEKEIDNLKIINQNLLNQISDLKEQIEKINTNIEIQIKKVNNANNVLLNQKSSMITQLNNQLGLANTQLLESKSKIEEQVELLSTYKTQNDCLKEKEKKSQIEIMELKEQINKYTLNSKISNDNSKAILLINNIDKKISLLEKEKMI